MNFNNSLNLIVIASPKNQLFNRQLANLNNQLFSVGREKRLKFWGFDWFSEKNLREKKITETFKDSRIITNQENAGSNPASLDYFVLYKSTYKTV